MNDWPALKENRPMTDPIPLLTALQEIAPDILSAASSREVAERNATGEPGPLGKLSADLAAEAMADQGERTETLRRIVAAWRPRERPAPSATFTPDVLRALESAVSPPTWATRAKRPPRLTPWPTPWTHPSYIRCPPTLTPRCRRPFCGATPATMIPTATKTLY